MIRHVDCVVVGAGPGGMAAAAAAARAGQRVLLLDDNPQVGGQIWRRGLPSAEHKGSAEGRRRARSAAALLASGAEVLPLHRVFAAPGPGLLHALHEPADAPPSITRITYRTLILATGARERFLPFPGWTLPGVFGAGGLQAMVAGGYPVQGKRVLVAGTGPLLLAVAAHLREAGATVVGVAEQASLRQLAPFAAGLWRQPARLWQGLRYRLRLGRAPYRAGTWPVEAIARGDGDLELSAVRLSDGRRTWNEPCDLLACGFHLVPNTELPRLLGCELAGDFVRVDAQGQTSIPGVFCVGEPTGIAGIDAAVAEGEVAGRASAGQRSRLHERRALAQRRFGQRMAHAFDLRPDLRALPRPETLVCRCEDVPFSAFAGKATWTDAKLQSRCGMGSCQARVCGPAISFLLGWKPTSVRPPLFPVPIHALAEQQTDPKEIE